MTKQWSPSNTANPFLVVPPFEFTDCHGETHAFELLVTADRKRIVFGGSVNAGFLESGYIEREDHEAYTDALTELVEDLMVYYNDGPQYVSRIVCNERM